MEQHRTRPPQSRPRRGRAPLPPQAQGESGDGPTGAPSVESATVCRAGGGQGRRLPPLVRALRRFPDPRLTGLGSGLFAAASMLVLGFLDGLLFGGAVAVYGVFFVLVSGLTAGWVRKADLVTAPVAVPIAFALGAFFVGDGGDGLTGRLAGLVTTLATSAGWLYGGTLVAGLIVTVRKVRLMARKAAAQRRAARQEPAEHQQPQKAPKPRRA
ncbi:DUF6542 domain-containing protein [Streptomyces sp. HUAS MG91]|uniref:DUF6542 domain-containing protein n=1 Tax=Streptomyces tabacisoli TaxID=3156398 RepID=A0AAU8IXP6_9ACTN